MEDFATALESYTLETEPAPSEDNASKGTVIKITATMSSLTSASSQRLVPIAEVTDAHGNESLSRARKLSHGPARRKTKKAPFLAFARTGFTRAGLGKHREGVPLQGSRKGTVVERVKGGVSWISALRRSCQVRSRCSPGAQPGKTVQKARRLKFGSLS